MLARSFLSRQSGAENFTECGLKWFLGKSGGTDGDSTAQLLGSVIHEFAGLEVEEPGITDEALQNKLIDSWPLIDDSQGWIEPCRILHAPRRCSKDSRYFTLNLWLTITAPLQALKEALKSL
jgi:hypothetical protein